SGGWGSDPETLDPRPKTRPRPGGNGGWISGFGMGGPGVQLAPSKRSVDRTVLSTLVAIGNSWGVPLRWKCKVRYSTVRTTNSFSLSEIGVVMASVLVT